jgi:hypothetical protein
MTEHDKSQQFAGSSSDGLPQTCAHTRVVADEHTPGCAAHCVICGKQFTAAELEQMGCQIEGATYTNVDDGSHYENNNGNF